MHNNEPGDKATTRRVGAAADVELIREVFSYLRQFRGKTFVFKVENSVIDDPLFPSLVKDLSVLHGAGIRVVIVPGAKERIDQVLASAGVASRIVKNTRIAAEEAIPLIKMAAFDVSNRVMTMLAASGVTAVVGNWVKARGMGVIDGLDFQTAGIVESVRVDTVRRVLEDAVIPVFPCIGWSAVGKPYNISSSELAVVLAKILGAEKLFLITSRKGYNVDSYAVPDTVPIAPGGRIANFSLSELEAFFAKNPGKEDELEPLLHAQRACSAGVERSHILDGRRDGVILLETFSNLGFGTMVYSNKYGGIRPMEPSDIADVLRIMQPFVERGVLLPRTEDLLQEMLQDYIVFELDGSVHACAALHDFPPETAEIAGIAVDEQFAHLGVGPKLVGYLCEKAQKKGLSHVFALTTQTADWFEKMGFEEKDVSALPERKRLSYNHARKSRVFVKSLS